MKGLIQKIVPLIIIPEIVDYVNYVEALRRIK